MGGTLRELALVPWLLLLVVITGDLLLSFRRRSDALGFDAPHEIFVGEEGQISLFDPDARAGQSARVNWPEGLSGPDEIGFEPVDGGGAAANVKVRGVRRGNWSLEDIWLLWSSRFRFFEFVPKRQFGAEIKVIPLSLIHI